MLDKLVFNVLMQLPETKRRQAYLTIVVLMLFVTKHLPSHKKENYKTDRRIRVLVFDRRFSGNIRAFIERAQEDDFDIEFGYLNLDIENSNRTHAQLPKGVKILQACSVADMSWAYGADVFLTSIFAWRFRYLVKKVAPHIKFCQLFHSIPIQGEPDKWFKYMGKFDAIFCSSRWMKDNFYVPNGIASEKLIPTGYANMDVLSRPKKTKEQICEEFKLDPNKKIVLLAPTLYSLLVERGIQGIDLTDQAILQKMQDLASAKDIQLVIRAHPHESISMIDYGKYDNLFFRHAYLHPNAIEQIYIADILISDISGLAVYYTALKRPIIFFGVQENSLGDNIGFLDFKKLPGECIIGVDKLLVEVAKLIESPGVFYDKFEKRLVEISNMAFGNTLDGDCGLRYYQELKVLLQR